MSRGVQALFEKPKLTWQRAMIASSGVPALGHQKQHQGVHNHADRSLQRSVTSSPPARILKPFGNFATGDQMNKSNFLYPSSPSKYSSDGLEFYQTRHPVPP